MCGCGCGGGGGAQPELKKAGAVKAVVGVMAMHEEALELQVHTPACSRLLLVT